MRTRDGLYYIMTGELFDGRKAAEMGLVNEAVPKEKLRERVRELADVLLEKSPAVLKGADPVCYAVAFPVTQGPCLFHDYALGISCPAATGRKAGLFIVPLHAIYEAGLTERIMRMGFQQAQQTISLERTWPINP
jgi:hypothetical protein